MIRKLSQAALLIGVGAIINLTANAAQAVQIAFNWDWEIIIQPVPGTPLPQDPITVSVWGPSVIDFADVPGLDLGTQENPLPLPPGQTFTIPIEILSMNLTGTNPSLGNVELNLRPGNQSVGAATVQNDNGVIVGNSFFDVFVELEFDNPQNPGQRMTIFNPNPINVGMDFTRADNIPAIDTFWIPTWLWREFRVNSPELVDEFGVPWVLSSKSMLTKLAPPNLRQY